MNYFRNLLPQWNLLHLQHPPHRVKNSDIVLTWRRCDRCLGDFTWSSFLLVSSFCKYPPNLIKKPIISPLSYSHPSEFLLSDLHLFIFINFLILLVVFNFLTGSADSQPGFLLEEAWSLHFRQMLYLLRQYRDVETFLLDRVQSLCRSYQYRWRGISKCNRWCLVEFH